MQSECKEEGKILTNLTKQKCRFSQQNYYYTYIRIWLLFNALSIYNKSLYFNMYMQ